jgi:putative flippase GtrA
MEDAMMMTTFTKGRQNRELERFVCFLIVGVSGTLLDFGLLTLLKMGGFATLVANSLAFSAGLVNNFTWNRLWTYSDSRRKGWAVQLGQFMVVSLVGLTLNNAIVLLFEAPFGALLNHPELGYLPAKLLATGVIVFWNFFLNRYWTFNDVKGK